MKMQVAFAVVALAALAASQDCVAGSLHVKPTTISLSPGQSASVMTVTNAGDTPMDVQVRVVEWGQVRNAEDLKATQKLVASPPRVRLAPKSSQSVRIVRVAKQAVTKEESYRLLVDEVVDPRGTPGVGVAMQIRYSVPVFVLPAAPAAGAVKVTATSNRDTLSLNATNAGGLHAQLADVSVENAAGAVTPVTRGLLGYVLPGASREWRLTIPANAAANGRPVRMRALVNGQELAVDL